MNVRLIKAWQWQSGIVSDNIYQINQYDVRINMHTTTMVPDDHDVSYGRVQYWFQEIMQDAVMMSTTQSAADAYQATGQRVLLFPEHPVDQLVGIMLCLKLNKICEGRLVITDVEISSDLGDGMIYLHNASEAQGSMESPGWWTDIGPSWCSPGSVDRGNKIVSLSRTPEWAALDLEWLQQHSDQGSSVLFGDFTRNDDQ